jgi:hypothetical protein
MSRPNHDLTPITAWSITPEWQEHPLEALLGSELDPKYIARSQARGLAVHRSDSLQRMVLRWAKSSRFRNAQAVVEHEPQRILSRNVFLYELKTSTEVRSEPHAKRIPLPARYVPHAEAPLDVWDVEVPESARFAQVKPTPIRIPGSDQVVVCEDCDGQGELLCAECTGRGTVERMVKVRAADGSVTTQPQERACTPCQGSGMIACRRCNARGELLEEQLFLWSRITQTVHAEDDPTAPHPGLLNQQAQVVFRDAVRLDDPRWKHIPAIVDLITQVTRAHAHDGVVLDAELTIRATPLTDITYLVGGRSRSIAVIGYTNVVAADRSFYDWRSIAIVALVVLAVIITTAIVIVWR